jgi:hypothetical protein
VRKKSIKIDSPKPGYARQGTMSEVSCPICNTGMSTAKLRKHIVSCRPIIGKHAIMSAISRTYGAGSDLQGRLAATGSGKCSCGKAFSKGAKFCAHCGSAKS